MDRGALVTLAAGRKRDVSTLYFAAKAPRAGEAKTRLGASIGMGAAAALYAAFLRDISRRFASAPFATGWYIAPGSRSRLLPLMRRDAKVRVQRGEAWADRQANLFRDCADTGEDRVVLVATDSPQLTPTRVQQAFDALEAHDAVFGPTLDGGYYLVGMNGFHDVLEGIEMSTDSALAQVLDRCARRALSVALLEPEFDVDTVADLERLEHEVRRRADLAHTAAALDLIRGACLEAHIA